MAKRSCSAARDSSVVSCVAQVVVEALWASQRSPGAVDGAWHLSREPGVIEGVSPTLSCDERLFFLSKCFLARALSRALYSFSMAARSR